MIIFGRLLPRKASPLSAVTPAPDALPTVVLDSNVVLDWLLFRDPAAAALGRAIRNQAVRWHATAAMRHELEHVLTRDRFEGWQGSARDVLDGWDRWAQVLPEPAPPLVVPLRCTDPDDQKFIDLALHVRPALLISRDKAVLRLAKRARALSVRILAPSAWTIDPPA
jgi:predicted nucleic acid-binding protein